MKSLVFIVVLNLVSALTFGGSSDTTVTSFEIQLKRKTDHSLGFNTNSIDRQHIYKLVTGKLQGFDNRKFHSIHDPYVVMRFIDVSGKDNSARTFLSNQEKQALGKYHSSYFIKIYGHLHIDKPLYQDERATFTLKVYVFDAEGNLVKKCKSRSRDKAMIIADKDINENRILNENQFFELLAEAADSIDLSI